MKANNILKIQLHSVTYIFKARVSYVIYTSNSTASNNATKK